MRSEKRKKILVYLMALLVVLSIPAVYLRLSFCMLEAPPPVIETITGVHGSVYDREGNRIYSKDGCSHDEYYNTVDGIRSNGNVDSTYTLAYQFGPELAAQNVSLLSGYDAQTVRADGASMTTTLLPGDDLAALRKAFGEYDGAVFAYNYKTGEIYVMLSLPSVSPDKAPGGKSKNDNLGTFMPGSCFKVVTAACALSQDPELEHFTYTCTGSHTLGDGKDITCGVVHGGPLTLRDAIGRSCNCYFAALISQLEPKQVGEIMGQMGITLRKGDAKAPMVRLDRLLRETSSTVFSDPASSHDVWSMIGEVGNTASLIDLACIAGAMINGGSSAAPYLVESIYDPNEEEYTYNAARGSMNSLIGSSAAARTEQIWSEATEAYYRSGKNTLDSRISHGKTGTSEIGEGNNRLILGAMEEYDTAFAIVVEGLPAGDPLMISIANVLADLIPAQ